MESMFHRAHVPPCTTFQCGFRVPLVLRSVGWGRPDWVEQVETGLELGSGLVRLALRLGLELQSDAVDYRHDGTQTQWKTDTVEYRHSRT